MRAARRAELPEILRVQQEAFTRVSRMFSIPPETMPPLRETVDDLEGMWDRGFQFYVATADERVVGTVRAERRPDGVVEIGRLGVDAAYERRGIARRLMETLEDSWPEVSRFELFTGAEAVAPLGLYRGMGYEVFEHDADDPAYLVWLAKERHDDR